MTTPHRRGSTSSSASLKGVHRRDLARHPAVRLRLRRAPVGRASGPFPDRPDARRGVQETRTLHRPPRSHPCAALDGVPGHCIRPRADGRRCDRGPRSADVAPSRSRRDGAGCGPSAAAAMKPEGRTRSGDGSQLGAAKQDESERAAGRVAVAGRYAGLDLGAGPTRLGVARRRTGRRRRGRRRGCWAGVPEVARPATGRAFPGSRRPRPPPSLSW